MSDAEAQRETLEAEAAFAAALARIESVGNVSEEWLQSRFPHCWEEVRAALELESSLGAGVTPSVQLGPYRLLRFLGAGGMGRVYLAETVREVEGVPPGEPVALKIMHPHLVRPVVAERFLREARVGRRVRHPNLVRVFDARASDVPAGESVHFLAMEHVPGDTLRDVLDRGGVMDVAACLWIAREVLSALSAMHRAGIVHRDIKPANLMLTPTGRVKVLDLGLASLHAERARLSQTGQFLGSFPYAAPEQFERRGRSVDGRADLFALGVTLFELATGSLPWGSDRAGGLVRDTSLAPPRLTAFRPHGADFLSKLVDELLQVDPEDRYASTADVLASIAASGEPVRRPGTRPVPAPPRIPDPPELGDALRSAARGAGRVVFVRGSHPATLQSVVEVFVDRVRRGSLGCEVVRLRYGSPPSDLRHELADAFFASRWTSRVEEGGPAFDAVRYAMLDRLETAAGRGPVLLLLENAAHATPIEQALLRAAADAVADMRVLVVARGSQPSDWLAHLVCRAHGALIDLSEPPD